MIFFRPSLSIFALSDDVGGAEISAKDPEGKMGHCYWLLYQPKIRKMADTVGRLWQSCTHTWNIQNYVYHDEALTTEKRKYVQHKKWIIIFLGQEHTPQYIYKVYKYCKSSLAVNNGTVLLLGKQLWRHNQSLIVRTSVYPQWLPYWLTQLLYGPLCILLCGQYANLPQIS